MKKRIGTAILSILCFILVLQPVHAADDRIDVMSAYVIGKELSVFLDVPDEYDPSTFQVYRDGEEENNLTLTPIGLSGKCAHYLFLVEHSANMDKYGDVVSAFVNGIDGNEKLTKDFNLCFYNKDGMEAINFGQTAAQIENLLTSTEYRGDSANPYEAVTQAFDEVRNLNVASGDPVYIFLICSGKYTSEGSEHYYAAKTAIGAHHEVMFGTLSMKNWANTDDERAFTAGTAEDYVIANYNDATSENDAAGKIGAEFAQWNQRSLSLVNLPLNEEEIELAKSGKLSVKFGFKGGTTYTMGGGTAKDAPPMPKVKVEEIRIYGEDPSAEPTGADEKVSGNEVVPDDGQDSENPTPTVESASDNDATPTEGTASDNDADPDDKNVSDNSASENGAVSDNGKPPWSRDRDKDEDEEEKDEKDGLPGYVIPLAIGGVVILAMLVVVIILLTKKKKPSVVNPGMGPDVPPNFEPDAIGSTMAVTPAAAMASAEHSRPSNVDQAEDALLAITVEVYAGHCMRSSAVIYLHDLISFGSDNICDVLFRDPGVEAEHLRISLSEGRVVVEDLSVGGVYVNGMRIQSRNPLRSGDVIGMGEAEFALKWSV